ncbi:MAG: phosphate ABC transporter permease subunit PstC, partial [Woeseiaceae bacterium]|nr:phosphate ABC transporter permease subunit PstC [Woeseiaceae bacterium]NIP22183.1 phosphate ABC transporter permease subunit PstC [Woeseiaceae bacterium]
MSFVAFFLGRRRALVMSGERGPKLHSLPVYYGHYVTLWCLLPALAVLSLWIMIEPRIVMA